MVHLSSNTFLVQVGFVHQWSYLGLASNREIEKVQDPNFIGFLSYFLGSVNKAFGSAKTIYQCM
jgi:hypothetical protein